MTRFERAGAKLSHWLKKGRLFFSCLHGRQLMALCSLYFPL